jgi:CheY-like chemotaxis protein
VYVQGPFLPETLEIALEHADMVLAELRSSVLESRNCPSGGAAIESSSGLTPDSFDGHSEMPLGRDQMLTDSTQTELELSLLRMHIQRKPPTPPSWIPKPPDKPMTLLVDDNAVNLRLLEMYCNRRGIPYRTAKDGQQAVHLFNESLSSKCDPLLRQELPAHPFDLVLMDLQMPICDGIEATRQIRELEMDHGRGRCVLFIVTGQDSPADRKGATDAGADGYLVKPVGPKVLDRWVKQWFPAADI